MAAIPEQQIPPQDVTGGGGSYEPISSRWPKAEVLALISLRSGLEARYQDAGPKGPLWEEISAGMNRLGYKRNSKRCKEKWENINKYFKKVKESNKKRPEDSKTCPYYHELEALYTRKQVSSTTIASGSTSTNIEPTRPSDAPSNLFEEGNGGEATKEPEDIVKELTERQTGSMLRQQLTVDDYEKMEEGADSENTELEEGEEEDVEDDEDNELEEESKMDYKIEFQRQNTGGASNNGGGNGAPSFMAMVQ